MKSNELMQIVENILSETRVGVFATVDEHNRPHIRWMVSAVLRGRPGALFTVTTPDSAKVRHIQECPHVEWMIQTVALDKVVNLKGKTNVLDNPSIKAEVMEAIGSLLNNFWQINKDKSDFIVLETVIEEGFLSYPTKGKVEFVRFK